MSQPRKDAKRQRPPVVIVHRTLCPHCGRPDTLEGYKYFPRGPVKQIIYAKCSQPDCLKNSVIYEN